MEAYCVRDKKKVKIVNPHERTTSNGRSQVVGKCPICHHEVYRFVASGRSKGRGIAGQGLYF